MRVVSYLSGRVRLAYPNHQRHAVVTVSGAPVVRAIVETLRGHGLLDRSVQLVVLVTTSIGLTGKIFAGPAIWDYATDDAPEYLKLGLSSPEITTHLSQYAGCADISPTVQLWLLDQRAPTGNLMAIGLNALRGVMPGQEDAARTPEAPRRSPHLPDLED